MNNGIEFQDFIIFQGDFRSTVSGFLKHSCGINEGFN